MLPSTGQVLLFFFGRHAPDPLSLPNWLWKDWQPTRVASVRGREAKSHVRSQNVALGQKANLPVEWLLLFRLELTLINRPPNQVGCTLVLGNRRWKKAIPLLAIAIAQVTR
jgi:hypothetical protein